MSFEEPPMEEMLPLLRTAIEQMSDAVLVTDAELNEPGPRIQFANPAFLQMTGYAWAELRGRSPRLLQGPKTDPRLRSELRSSLRAGRPFAGEGVNYRKNGTPYHVEWQITPLRDAGGVVRHFIAVQRDVTFRRQYEERLTEQRRLLEQANASLEALATTDGLTGLKNHRHFRERLETEFARARRGGESLSVLMLDVDRFKQYNDRYGHPAGDEVLCSVAQILQEGVAGCGCVARYGGEEFAVLLPGAGAEEGIVVGQRLRAAVAAYPWTRQPVTTSVGVTTLTAACRRASDLVDAADRALYRVKALGRNGVIHSQDLMVAAA